MEKASTSSAVDSSNTGDRTVEIKIKTLDSQVYSCRVDRNVSIPELKEHVANLTGVSSERQRLICRGKVLKDDHNLSDYNVEDGHTLHLVTRQAPPSSNASASTATNEVTSEEQGSRNRPTQISHGVVMGTFNVPDNGDGGLPDVNRIISSVLTSLGLPNINPANESGGIGDRPQPRVDIRHQAQAPRIPPTVFPAFALPSMLQQFRTFQQPIPDALTTMSHYLDGLEQAFAGNVTGQQGPDLGASGTNPISSSEVVRGHPTPATLGAIMRRTMTLISNRVRPELDRLFPELENEQNLVDASVRDQLQSLALHDGVLLQHLGALLLELGRATLTLRMGASPVESILNVGPAVFISSSGPNPMMVQPLPFQPGARFGATTLGSQQASGAGGAGEVPRNISIHIHANDTGMPPSPFQAAVPGQSTGSNNISSTVATESNSGVTSTSVPSNIASSIHAIAIPVQSTGTSTPVPMSDHSGARVVPVRAVVATMSPSLGRSETDATIAPSGILHPLFARFQQLNSQQMNVASIAQATPQVVASSGTTTSQLSSNLPAPTIRAQVQVQAWVPDGQGGSRLLSNEEALRTLFTPPIASSQPNLPQESNREASQNNPSDERSDLTVDVGSNEHEVVEQISNIHADLRTNPLDEAAKNLRTLVDGEKEVKDQNGESSTDASKKTGPKDKTVTDAPSGLGLKGLQPLPARAPKKSMKQHTPSTSGHTQGESAIPIHARDNSIASVVGVNAAQESALPGHGGANQQPSTVNLNIENMGNLLSQFMTNTTTAGRVRDSNEGIGVPPRSLGSLVGQVMQNPFMRNVVQQVVEQVGEETTDHDRGFPSGLDFSRLLQQMMPVVGQALSSAASNPLQESSLHGTEGLREGTNISDLFQQMMPVVNQAFGNAFIPTARPEEASGTPLNSEPGMNGFVEPVRDSQQEMVGMNVETHPDSTSSETPDSGHTAKRQKIHVEKAAEKLAQGSSGDEVFRIVAETADMLLATNEDREDSSLLIEYLCEDVDLIEDYITLLVRDLSFGNHADE